MNHRKLTLQRRAVSQIIGSLFMLAIVAAFGSILLFQGLEGSRDFTEFLDIFNKGQGESVKEDLMITHVKFGPSNKHVNFWIRNTGSTDIVIDRITMVRIDTQALIVNNKTSTSIVQIFPGEIERIDLSGGSVSASPSSITFESNCDTWDDTSGCTMRNGHYRLTVVTSRGNIFETVAQPFNT
ncbi:MAG: hypothetical protein ACT4OW_01930 [Nitrososphaerota archaeon]